MNILEKELEDVIYEAMLSVEGQGELQERGLYLHGFPFRQVNLGAYGIADIVSLRAKRIQKDYSTFNQLEVNIIELKKNHIDVNTLLQAVGYAKGIKEAFSEYEGRIYQAPDIHIALIGKTIDINSNFCYIADVFNVTVYTYKLDLVQGLTFESHIDYSPKNPMRLDPKKAASIIFKNRRDIWQGPRSKQ